MYAGSRYTRGVSEERLYSGKHSKNGYVNIAEAKEFKPLRIFKIKLHITASDITNGTILVYLTVMGAWDRSQVSLKFGRLFA